jgi:hypothetical protein
MPISTSEITSFRPIDHLDISGARTARTPVYDIPDIPDIPGVARVHLWSTGGVIGNRNDSMIHVGIQIENIGGHGIEFDSSTFELVIFHACGAQLPTPKLTSIMPLGPTELFISPATSVTLDLYFTLAVHPQLVASMRANWFILTAAERIARTTNFVLDDKLRSRQRAPLAIAALDSVRRSIRSAPAPSRTLADLADLADLANPR